MSRPETGKMRFGDEVGLFMCERDVIRLRNIVGCMVNVYTPYYNNSYSKEQERAMLELFDMLTEVEQQGAKEQTMKPFDECKKGT